MERIRALMNQKERGGKTYDSRAVHSAMGMWLKAIETLTAAQKNYTAPPQESDTPPIAELVASPAALDVLLRELFALPPAVAAIRQKLAELDLTPQSPATPQSSPTMHASPTMHHKARPVRPRPTVTPVTPVTPPGTGGDGWS